MRRDVLSRCFVISVATVSWLALSFVSIDTATAASISSASNTLSRSQIGTEADHEIKFVTPSGVEQGETILINFSSAWDVSSIMWYDVDFATGSTNDCDTAFFTEQNIDGFEWSAGAISATTIRIISVSKKVLADRCVRIRIGLNAVYEGDSGSPVNQIVNPATPGEYTISISGTFGDVGSVAVSIVSDDSVDVSTEVTPSISCVVDNTTSSFGTFTSGTVATASNTVTWTISTNAANGYVLTVQNTGNGVSPGLYSPVVNYLIGSADNSFNATANLNSVSIGYGLQGSRTNGDAGSAPTTVAARYNQTANNVGGFELTPTPLASATGPVANATVVSTFKAKVSGTVIASSYTDRVTYICTGIY